MLESKAGLLAVGEFVRKSWAGTRRGHLGERQQCEGSGNSRRGEEDSRDWEEEEERIGDRWEEMESERWLEWNIVIMFHYAYGARGYEAATNIHDRAPCALSDILAHM